MLHAYLSAFAFFILMFFSLSGLLLNHPEWFAREGGEGELLEVELPAEALDELSQKLDEGAGLALYLQKELSLVGAFQSAEIFPGEEAFLRFGGAKGSSDVTVDLATGFVEYEIEKSGMVELMHNLHRGKESGAAWKGLIDVSAILILLMSLFGFFLMFFIRIRFAKSMILLGTSAVSIAAIYFLFVP
ncbi:MAG: PepSY-associated TM helix domain-containing protein [Verrucomicrobiota bacterium]